MVHWVWQGQPIRQAEDIIQFPGKAQESSIFLGAITAPCSSTTFGSMK